MSQEQIEAVNYSVAWTARQPFSPTKQAARIRRQVEKTWTHVMNRILPGVTPNRVDLFGSQYYRLHTPTSDVDCAVVLAQEYMHLARELLLCMALRLGETFHLQEGSAQPNYQNANHTLKWTHQGDFCTSLLVDTEENVASSKNASVVLRRYFDAHEEYIDPVRTLIRSLREKGYLNPHGRDQARGTHLKSVTAALLCVSILENYSMPQGRDVMQWLLECIVVHMQSGSCCYTFRRDEQPTRALPV